MVSKKDIIKICLVQSQWTQLQQLVPVSTTAVYHNCSSARFSLVGSNLQKWSNKPDSASHCWSFGFYLTSLSIFVLNTSRGKKMRSAPRS